MDESPPLPRFVGRVAVVTGASDQGLGGAIAERLAREGASLYLPGLEHPRRLLKRLERLGAAAHYAECDVRDAAAVQQAMADCIERWQRIDVLVNNAGIEDYRPLAEYEGDAWQALIDVNLCGTIRMTQAALPSLIENKGVVINMSSMLGHAGCPNFSIYGASKAGISGFTQSLAQELAPRGVRVLAVAPGLCHTPMMYRNAERYTPRARERLLEIHPLGVGSPHDVAAAVAFLASEEARWMTGITVPLGWGPGVPMGLEANSNDS